MSRVSEQNFKKIAESVLSFLHDQYPIALSTRKIAGELARDNEFILKVLLFLEKQGLASRVREGKTGAFEKWLRWKLSKKAKERFDSAAEGGWSNES